jgi:hypothetical protein
MPAQVFFPSFENLVQQAVVPLERIALTALHIDTNRMS